MKHCSIQASAGEITRWPCGVAFYKLQKHADQRGFFMELLRRNDSRLQNFRLRQISVSETRSGVIKAFHYHKKQTDIFCPLEGDFRIVLYDNRKQEPTFGRAYSILTSPKAAFLLRIPPRVLHGYQVLGDKPGLMLYVTSREYDPTDEFRIDWNDSKINFPW